MKLISTAAFVAGLALLGATHAQAQSVDLSAYLKSQEGIAGLAAAAANLGNCTTELKWAPGFDFGTGEPKTDAVAVSCEIYDPDTEDMMEKTTIVQFQFLEGRANLIGMDHLP